MVVTKKLTVDLARKTILGTVDAVRGDSAIALELTLLSDGEPWVVPANASVIMRYCQGKAGGEYDTLPDGTVAWKAAGNVLTIRVAPEVCSAAGKTDFQVTILKGADQISTFRMVVDVEGEVSGTNQPGDYTNLSQWLLENSGDGGVSATVAQKAEAALAAANEAVAMCESHEQNVVHLSREDVQEMIDASIAGIAVYNGEVEDV